ncbi:hypothetical protein G9A89_023364 [Geosiphon pyriformis]|nr:hypothetical protein G9A89_023364 [Geosiphon pyriformis]
MDDNIVSSPPPQPPSPTEFPPLPSSPPSTATDNPATEQPTSDLVKTHRMLLELFCDPLLADLRALAGVEDVISDVKLKSPVLKTHTEEEGVAHDQRLFESEEIGLKSMKQLVERVTVDHVETLIALEQGNAFEIYVKRGGVQDLVLVIKQNATVFDLKNMIKTRIERDENEKNERKKNEEKALKKRKFVEGGFMTGKGFLDESDNQSSNLRIKNGGDCDGGSWQVDRSLRSGYDGLSRKKKKQERRKRRNKKISWRYIWNSYCLMFEGQRLLNDKARIQELGIRSASVLKFSRLANKGDEKHRNYQSW